MGNEYLLSQLQLKCEGPTGVMKPTLLRKTLLACSGTLSRVKLYLSGMQSSIAVLLLGR
jgi:hypothetical protein